MLAGLSSPGRVHKYHDESQNLKRAVSLTRSSRDPILFLPWPPRYSCRIVVSYKSSDSAVHLSRGTVSLNSPGPVLPDDQSTYRHAKHISLCRSILVARSHFPGNEKRGAAIADTNKRELDNPMRGSRRKIVFLA